MSQFFAGLKISASYAIVGAVISEWLGGFSGLGVYMTRVKKAFAFDKMFAVIFLISIISLLLMKCVELLQKKCMKWENVDTDLGVIRVRKTLQRIYILDEGKKHTELLLDTPKTANSIRDIPMSNELIKVLKPIKCLSAKNININRRPVTIR